MSDDAPLPRHAARRSPKRQDWLPNRMFDPVNNPFAIQNLLAREREKEDALFHIDAPSRPGASYSGNPLLKEREILPSKDFAVNRLLKDTARFDQAFQAEYEARDDETDSQEAGSDPHEASIVAEIADIADIADVTENAPHDTADTTAMAAVDASTADPITETLAEAVEQRASPDTIADSRAETDFASDPAAISRADAIGETALQPSLAPTAQDDHHQAASLAASDTAQMDSGAEISSSPEMLQPDLQSDLQPEQIAAETETENLPATSATEATASRLDSTEGTETDALALASSPAASARNEADELAASAESDAAMPELSASQTSNENETPAETHQALSAPSASSALSDDSHQTHADPDAEPSSQPVVADDAEAAEEPPGLSSELMRSRLEAAREEAREAAYHEGLEAGRDQAMSELQQSVDDKIAQLNQVLEGLQRLSEDPDTLFEPMKKLAVHLAEQLVRGELSQSPQTISRLVDNCLRELAASGEKAVIVHLNPEDVEQYKPVIAPLGDSIVLRPDATLTRGSVRTSLDGSVVEDLIERRVKGIQKSLAQPVASSWRPALPNPLVQRAQPQPPTTASKSSVVEEATDTAEDVFSADDDLNGAEQTGAGLTGAELTHSDAATEPIDTTGTSDIATESAQGDTEPGATP